MARSENSHRAPARAATTRSALAKFRGRRAQESSHRLAPSAESPAQARSVKAAVAKSAPTRPPRSPRKSGVRRFFSQALSIGAMTGVAALIVSTSLPANAFYSPDVETSAAAAPKTEADIQNVTVNAAAATAAAAAAPIARDTYEARSFVQQVRLLSGNQNFAYTNNPNGSIQWPFPAAVPISYGFGPRSACSYCSTYHLGVDFTPGSGVPIQSITEGVVSEVNLDSGGLGNHVIIDHVVNGQRVQSVYAHMQWGSIQVAVGQPVSVGTIVGLVGSTGASTGAHLHLEIHLDGTPIDPFSWLKANAN